MSEQSAVLQYADINPAELAGLLGLFQLEICITGETKEIPGSYWGDEEAGLIKNRLYLRTDTPVHSILHEAWFEQDANDARSWLLKKGLIDKNNQPELRLR